MVEKEYKCNVRGAAFDSQRELDGHNRSMHPQNRCEECGRTFKSEGELKTHYWIAHPQETPVR
jgi:hypothetical protein